MSKLKVLGKLNPVQYKQMLDHLTKKKIKNPFIKADDIIVNKKPEVEEREVINAFMKRNPRKDLSVGGFVFKGIRNLYKGKKGLQVGRIEKELVRKYKDEGMDFIDAITKANDEANAIVDGRKLDIVKDALQKTDIRSDDYIKLIDEEFRLEDPESYTFIKDMVERGRDDLANKTRALRFPDWAEANFGENYQEVLLRNQAKALKQRSDEIDRMYPADDVEVGPSFVGEAQTVREIDEMNKANLDEILKGRKKNADGGRIGFDDGGMLVQPSADGSRPGYREPIIKRKVRQYLKNLPKNSEVVVLDIAKELKIDRGNIDKVLKEKEIKNKNFKIVRRAGFITNEDFIKEFKKYQKSDEFITGEDKEFAKYLNDKGLKAETKSGEHNAKSIITRRKRLGIKSASVTQPRFSDKEILKEAKRFKINTKDLSPEKIRQRVLERRQNENLRKRRAEDPELDERIRKMTTKATKKRYDKLKSTEEGKTILRDIARKAKAIKYQKEGLDPPANSAKEMLWKDSVRTAKGDGRFNIVSGYKKSMKKGDYYSNKIKIKDSVTGKTFTFNTLENFINKNAGSFNVKNFEEVIRPYKQKQYINDKGFRNILNEVLIPGWSAGDPRTAYTIQHDFGRNINPFKVSLAFYNDNIKEYKIRSDFERAWQTSKTSKTPLKDRKLAFNVFKKDLGALNIRSSPSMVTRDRAFGKELDLKSIFKKAKKQGAILPRGALKEAAEFEKALASRTGTEGFIDLDLFRDVGRGVGAGFKALPTLAPTAALTAGFGVDPTSAIDRATLATEAAFAPGLVQQAAKFSPAVQRVLNLGLSPQLALRAARIASPLGIASLAGEGVYQAGKFAKKRLDELRAMSPEQRQELRSQGARQAFDPFQAAGGGIAKEAGDPSGAMLESMNPDSQGLPGLLKRVRNR